MRTLTTIISVAALLSIANPTRAQQWSTFAANPQHTGDSIVPAQALSQIRWSTSVDLQPQLSGDELLIHYGSPVFTSADTALVPVKTGTTDGFEVEAINTANGSVKYTLPSDYTLPPHNWTPVYQPTLTPQQRLYYSGAGGTVYFRDTPDLASGTSGQIPLVDTSTYQANKSAFDSDIKIDTGIVSDASGNIYFGYYNSGAVNLPGGVGTASGIRGSPPPGR